MSRGFYTKRTGQSEEQVKEWMDAETWFTADEAVEYGFADEVLEAEVSGETPAAACATVREMDVMRGLYKSVPEQIATKEQAPAEPPVDNTVSNGTPVAGDPSEINHLKEENPMELDKLTVDELREGNPALYEQVQQSAVAAERTRLEDIDALTVPGYEEMAAQAKADGTSAMDFQKMLVAEMKKKGSSFMQARQQETAPAAQVAGGDPAGNTKTEEQEIQEYAKDVAKYAEQLIPGANDGMF